MQQFFAEIFEDVRYLKYKTEKHDLESLEVENENFKKKLEGLNKEKLLVMNIETSLGLGSTITTSGLSILNPNFGIVLISSKALNKSVAVLITNEYIPKMESI